MRRFFAVLLLFIVLFVNTSCSGLKRDAPSKGTGISQPDPGKKDNATSSGEGNKDIRLAAWTVYWDSKDAPSEIRDLGDKLSEIVYFAAYYDSNNKLFIPEKTSSTFEKVQSQSNSNSYTHYLSIVNDRINRDGSSSLKSSNLLQELFNDEETLDLHIEDIMSTVRDGGYDGVEIDYEGIRKNTALWNRFIDFSSRLYVKLSDNNLKMRIVLEPSAPVDKLKFPEGPEYVVMCYNLYGTGTKPGPKADKQFILGLADKMSYLPGNKSFALAAGGFDWHEKGNAKAITEQEAESLLREYSESPVRDESSGALTFMYTDEKGSKHEVWYGDGTTLDAWVECIKDKGYSNISLWRLSGNNRESLRLLGE